MGLAIRRVTAAIGAELLDVDLSAPLTPALQEDLRAALGEHLVLFARGQHLDDDAHRALARVFGEPMVHPFEVAAGRNEPVHRIVDKPGSLPDRAGWHTDDTYLACPPAVAVLRCLVAPEAGGDTAWANMALAYEKLSESMQQFLDPLQGFHATDGSLLEYMRAHFPADLLERASRGVGDGATHPIVFTHPETGRKAIFIEPQFMKQIVGLPEHESDFVCQFLASLANDVSLQCRFRWNEGDVAIWDERMTQHVGSADHAGQERVLARCIVSGERSSQIQEPARPRPLQ